MKKNLLNILPWLRLREKNIVWYKRWIIYIESFLAIVLIAWIIWLFVGIQIVFNHKFTIENIAFYTVDELSEKERKTLHDAITAIKKELRIKGIYIKDIKASIFLEEAGDIYYRFSLIPGMQFTDIYGSALTFDKYIFIPNSNITYNQFMIRSGESVKLIQAMMHEMIHVWQNEKYGFGIFPILQKRWIVEGYAVYASKDTILNNILALQKIEQIKSKTSKETYALWGLMVKHAIEEMHVSVDDLHQGKIEYDKVLSSLLKAYNITEQ